ncbi:MAG TPA: peroxiredoxin [Planctomycetota bacterium]|nr:peroxiredoxin [Planctomycetota bacterium]
MRLPFFGRKPLELLAPGAPAPDFDLADHRGGRVRLADLRGRRVLLWFYPRASTSGCTAEGKGFRDRIPAIGDKGVILGMSFDTPAANRAFAEKHGFPFQLLCDTDKSVSMAYRACRSRRSLFPDRITYLIDAQGRIESAERVTDIAAHVESATARLCALK